MRGKESVSTCSTLECGITPAYAGKSKFIFDSEVSLWDHPRLCGEKGTILTVWSGSKGSPPPMRGKVSELFEKKFVPRITPAYAGKSYVLEDAECKN